MSKIAPRVFKGARDFLPEQMLHRERITGVMREVFKKYGFAPIETPAIEYLDVLTGKYGEDADRLIYKLNYKTGEKDEAALHYDLTVPFSRVVAMNPDLPMPFKRYQIQPVWRADRPQPHQGRFREFYQCDIDAVGSTSMLIDAELVAITYEVLSKLGFKTFLIKINNRKILDGVIQYAGIDKSLVQDVCRSIDKLDKATWEEVHNELKSKGIEINSIEKLRSILHSPFDYDLDTINPHLSMLSYLENNLPSENIAIKGIEELKEMFRYLNLLGVDSNNYTFDLSLARGLDYYTGPIFETKLTDQPHMGSLTGGGRYDGLIGMFTGKEMPSAGTTLGLDRIFTAMQQLNMLPEVKTSTQVLIARFSEATLDACLQLAAALRNEGVNTEVYPENAKLKKQFTYADKKAIPFMVIIGEEELANGTVALKNLKNSEQKVLSIADCIKELKG